MRYSYAIASTQYIKPNLFFQQPKYPTLRSHGNKSRRATRKSRLQQTVSKIKITITIAHTSRSSNVVKRTCNISTRQAAASIVEEGARVKRVPCNLLPVSIAEDHVGGVSVRRVLLYEIAECVNDEFACCGGALDEGGGAVRAARYNEVLAVGAGASSSNLDVEGCAGGGA